MRPFWAACSFALLSALVASAARAETVPSVSPVRVLVPGGSDDFWARALSPDALPPGMRVELDYAGHPESAAGEALFTAAVRNAMPDLALVSPEDAVRLDAAGLLADLTEDPFLRTARARWEVLGFEKAKRGHTDDQGVRWQAAGLTLPLLLVRPDALSTPPNLRTWEDVFTFVAQEAPTGFTMLDPGPFAETADWLRMRAGIVAFPLPGTEPDTWRTVRTILQALHDAPSATRFWQKRWAPDTAIFRRGRTALAIADTETLRATNASVDGVEAIPLPPLAKGSPAYPARVPAVWVVPAGTEPKRARALLEFIAGAPFAARVAEGLGWAPIRPDAWEHMRDLVERVPAWRTVQHILDTGRLSFDVSGDTATATRAALARGAGVWLAGLAKTPSDAWQQVEEAHELAWAQGTARHRSTIPRLPDAATPQDPATRHIPTLAQGERAVLPAAFEVREPLGAPGTLAMVARRNGTALSFPTHIFVLSEDTDELEPATATVDVGRTVHIEVAIPDEAPPGTYALAFGEWPMRQLCITAAPALPAVPALCGIGLPQDSPYFDAVGRLLLDHGLTPFPLSLESALLHDPRRGPVVLRRWHDPSKAEADATAAAEAGVGEDLLVYSHDEPTLLHFPHIRTEATVYGPLGMRVLVTHPPDPLLEGRAQVWGVHTSLRPTDTPNVPNSWRTTRDSIAKARSRGEQVWWYTAGNVAPLPNLQLHADLTRLHAAFYRLPALGFSGVLQADAAAWGENPDDLNRGALGIGEGVLCLPGGAAAQVNPTIRLKTLRDGLFTMRLLTALELALATRIASLPDADAWAGYPEERRAAYGRSVVQPAALALGDALHPFMHLTTDPAHLRSVDRNLRLELDGALRGPILLLRGDAPDWSVTTSAGLHLEGLVSPGAQVRIDDEEVPVKPDGAFAASVPLGPGRNAPEVVVTTGETSVSRCWHVWRTGGPLSPW